MRSRTGTALAVALGLWAGAASAGETLWEGEVHVIDAKTLAGVPDGPVLPLGGVESPPPDARCGPAAEGRACGELAVQALRDAVAGQDLVCEQDGDGIACRAGGIDIAEWMVRMGWALAAGDELREAQREARATRRGMWYEEERLGQTYDVPPAGFGPPVLPGEGAVRACMEAGENAFAQREYGNLMAIEAVEWLIEETRVRWERRHAMEGDGAETAPEVPDKTTRETLDTARELCDLLGSMPEGSGGETRDTSGEDTRTIEGRVARLADRARETCREAAAEAAGAGRIEDFTGMRQIARHTMLRTERLGERLWRAREQGDDEEARRMLGQAYAVFESAERQCNELTDD